MLIFPQNNVVSTSFEGLCRFRVHLTIEGPLIGYNWVLIGALLIEIVFCNFRSEVCRNSKLALNNVVSTGFEGLCRFRVHLTVI